MNLGNKALQVIKAVAPTIATAAFGPVGGFAVTELEKVFGVTKGDDKGLEASLLGATPEQLLALKNADQAFAARMRELGISEEKLAYDDTASARAREVAVKDWMPRILASVVVSLVIVAEGTMLYFGQPQHVDGVVLGRILGTLDAALMLVLGYYFGSSAGSAAKDKTLSEIAKQP